VISELYRSRKSCPGYLFSGEHFRHGVNLRKSGKRASLSEVRILTNGEKCRAHYATKRVYIWGVGSNRDKRFFGGITGVSFWEGPAAMMKKHHSV